MSHLKNSFHFLSISAFVLLSACNDTGMSGKAPIKNGDQDKKDPTSSSQSMKTSEISTNAAADQNSNKGNGDAGSGLGGANGNEPVESPDDSRSVSPVAEGVPPVAGVAPAPVFCDGTFPLGLVQARNVYMFATASPLLKVTCESTVYTQQRSCLPSGAWSDWDPVRLGYGQFASCTNDGPSVNPIAGPTPVVTPQPVNPLEIQMARLWKTCTAQTPGKYSLCTARVYCANGSSRADGCITSLQATVAYPYQTTRGSECAQVGSVCQNPQGQVFECRANLTFNEATDHKCP